MSERLVTAFHEAAHAVAAEWMGQTVNVVSIRACERHLGVVLHERLSFEPSEQRQLGKPVPLLPDGFRRAVEADVIVSLAGRVGELMTCRTGFADDHDERKALKALGEISSPLKPSSLDPHERRLLSAAEAGPPDEANGDEANALGLAFAMTGDDEEAAAYLRWLRILTARMFWSPSFIEAVERLVPALLEYEVLSGQQVREILEGESETGTGAHEAVQART
jgi:hypothetical protein